MEASNVPSPTPTLAERVEAAVELMYMSHGYLIEGDVNKRAIEEKVYDLVVVAVVDKTADRGKLAVRRRDLVAGVFPHVPGPDEWGEQEDPDLAEGVYKKLDAQIWRMVGPNKNDVIQSRLNSDLGLVLCRTKSTRDHVDAVYVTKNLACLLADFTKPQKDRISKEATRFAANLAMAVERLPEHGKRFQRELNTGLKTALGAGTAILGPALEAASAELEDEADDGGEQ